MCKLRSTTQTLHHQQSKTISSLLINITEKTYLPADSKYIDNGRLDDSENDSAACNHYQKDNCSAIQGILLQPAN